MITFGELIARTTFCDAARQGWIEVNGATQVPEATMGPDFWTVFQEELDSHRYEQTRMGLSFRAGQCGFQAFLDITGAELGLRTAEFRLLPVQLRLEQGFQILLDVCQASGFKHMTGDHAAGFNINYGEVLPEAAHGYLMGFFQEYFEWASQGKVYPAKPLDINGFCFAPEPLNL